MTVEGIRFSQEIQPNDGSCFCPFQSPWNSKKATSELFRQVYSTVVVELDLDDAKAVDELLEVQEYNCGNSAVNKETKVFFEFDSDIENSTLRESLQDAMKLVYNE